MAELTAEEKQARNEYMREWRKRNKAKAEQAEKRFWQKQAQKVQQGGGTVGEQDMRPVD